MTVDEHIYAPYKPRPIDPCGACGGTDWWWRLPSIIGGKGGWVCNTCHPKPDNEGV
jgi:hypothetical protein